jgi:hypothetical protein
LNIQNFLFQPLPIPFIDVKNLLYPSVISIFGIASIIVVILGAYLILARPEWKKKES